jgi:prepilin-type N-terminal cleavage/methylation domain-containing protein
MSSFQRIRRGRVRRSAAGFTLVELLTVVAIVGILATVAMILVQKHMRTGKSLEAITIISAIRSAQEAYRSETGSYLDATAEAAWFPAAPNGKTKHSFVAVGHEDAARWQQLGISRTDGTQFGFRTHAGRPGAVSVTLDTVEKVAFPNATEDWYVIEAAGDLDTSTAKLSRYVASSWTNELYIENEGE